MPAPSSATQIAFPDWTDLSDTWRERDAEWLRNRSVNIFTDTGNRTSLLAAPPMQGMLSYLQTVPANHPGGPDFYNPSNAWESIRYPNLSVISDATTVTLRRMGAGTGVQLVNDGSVNMAKTFIGTGGIGQTIDQTGVSLKVGAKTVKIATDANGLTLDSPLAITGSLTVSGSFTAASSNVSSITASTSVNTVALNASTVNATGAVTGATVTAGTVQLTGTQVKATSGSAALTLGTDSTVKIDGSALTINPPTTMAGALTVNGTTNFVGAANLAPAGKTAVPVAGIISVSGNVAPSQNAPDGTLYVTY